MRNDLLSRIGLLVLATALAGALAGGVCPAMGATPSTDYTNLVRVESPNPQATGRWAERLATVPDLTGDGRNEILIADLSEDFGGFTNGGRVYMQDGANRNLIYNITSPQIQDNANFGFYIAVIGDVNGDGKADFAAGTDAQDTLADGRPCTPPAAPAPLAGCNQDQGRAWVFSGVNGQTLYALDNPNPQGFARFGSRIGRAGDINGDGVPDVIVGASNNDLPAACGNDPATGRPLAPAAVPAGCRANEGEAFIFSGTNGALLRTLNVPASDRAPECNGSGAAPCGGFGLAVQG
ncbi:MAG TPA: VCBS repeat-containing protein, partial [Thermoleophilaceae bacterium]|nr:VCBS repeat-containing protein [Thermoleophilaceae bacterium]